MTDKEEKELCEFATPYLYLASAFFACEPPNFVLSFARDCGGGSITDTVQTFIWNKCISKSPVKFNVSYLRSFLKKLILEIESSGYVVLDELYEKYTLCLTCSKDNDFAKGNSRMLRQFSFIFPEDCSQASRKLEVTLQCSLNMLEGDTGCSIWPSGLFLSEFILSFPDLFSNKSCLEVGSGVGLVGVCLAHVNASKVILTDGDLSTLANMKLNLELNQSDTQDTDMVHCSYLSWDSATENELRLFKPDIVLGADVIYDPRCLPHLVRVLAILLNREEYLSPEGLRQGPLAYVASVIRNIDTFNYFLSLAEQESLFVSDITETMKPLDLLPYVKSYKRSSIRMFKISNI